MENETAPVKTELDYAEIAPLVEFFLLVNARPVTLSVLYLYLKSIPGVTLLTLVEFLTTDPTAANQFVSDGQGRWGLTWWPGVRAA